MGFLSDPIILSRIQFAVTSVFHMLWPVLTIGMAGYLVVVEILWLLTKNPDYYRHARFWSKIYILNFGCGVASGVALEFEFGANWSPFSVAVGDFFGTILGFEGTMAFMLEAAFLGIMISGWHRVPSWLHLLSTIMVFVGASLSSFWIIVANSWMQTPAGGEMVNGKFIVHDFIQAIFNPAALSSWFHMVLAILETALFVIGGISAWYILKNRHHAFFSKSFKLALALAIFVTPLQLFVGHISGEQVYHNQPTKLAAIEAIWDTIPAGESAPWTALVAPDIAGEKNHWEVNIPHALSYILEMKPTLSEPVQGLKEWKPQDRPHAISLIFYSFRIMVGIGFFLCGLMLFSVVQWWRGKLAIENITKQRWLMRGWIFAAPLGYMAVEFGWIVREVGRQPWTVYGKIRTADAVSLLPANTVLTSLIAYTVIYLLLFSSALYFGSRIVRQGPNLELPLPTGSNERELVGEVVGVNIQEEEV
ncbi:cytochrome ubiquinol oxidase subunit I [Fischerella thermalis]|uniref:cytochrome ubiquinol oxidase subunit I n=1 Tax=Fischerella thermalis TaxID=372787 RepID=UPI000C80AD51|nr:cytochrome ubiquinol oxidase subunit I [Fischerella thermalis]PLZ05219.1 cytochrome ubiquinol oxidase subunit I [Fischerella thermalis WC1110]PLZ38186.1 cytochrome ubiquinol oxidase subunit I [Fischerella thermalis WC538]PLZ40503.1 cytochrome ubiquinol oxidase subunit I [Fischerella thermalis WC527]